MTSKALVRASNPTNTFNYALFLEQISARENIMQTDSSTHEEPNRAEASSRKTC